MNGVIDRIAGVAPVLSVTLTELCAISNESIETSGGAAGAVDAASTAVAATGCGGAGLPAAGGFAPLSEVRLIVF